MTKNFLFKHLYRFYSVVFSRNIHCKQTFEFYYGIFPVCVCVWCVGIVAHQYIIKEKKFFKRTGIHCLRLQIWFYVFTTWYFHIFLVECLNVLTIRFTLIFVFFFIQLNQERMNEKRIFWLCEKKDYYYGNMFRIPNYLKPKTFYMRNFHSFFHRKKFVYGNHVENIDFIFHYSIMIEN